MSLTLAALKFSQKNASVNDRFKMYGRLVILFSPWPEEIMMWNGAASPGLIHYSIKTRWPEIFFSFETGCGRSSRRMIAETGVMKALRNFQRLSAIISTVQRTFTLSVFHT